MIKNKRKLLGILVLAIAGTMHARAQPPEPLTNPDNIEVLDARVVSQATEDGSKLLLVLWLQNTGDETITLLTKGLQLSHYPDTAPEISLHLSSKMTIGDTVIVPSLYDFAPVVLHPGEAAMIRTSRDFRRTYDEVVIVYDMRNDWSHRFDSWYGKISTESIKPMRVEKISPGLLD